MAAHRYHTSVGNQTMITSSKRRFLVAYFAMSGLTIFGPGQVAHANGISDFEGVKCVSEAWDMGLDTAKCADASLPDCQIPDWFPTDAQDYAGVQTSLKSEPAWGGYIRYNELSYSPADGTPAVDRRYYVHEWYSEIDIAYGPALPSWGHLWKVSDSSGLLRSFSCKDSGTDSYP